jgi:hypothetical protein
MKMFLIGALAVLAVLNPDVTKALLNKAVDTTHAIVTNALKETEK